MSNFRRSVLIRDDGFGERVELVQFTLYGEIHPGGPISYAVRKKLNQEGFEIGHLMARMLGGSGSDERNFVPMKPVLNRGAFKRHEHRVRDELRLPKTLHVNVEIKLYFKLGRKEPYKMFYDVFVLYADINTPYNFGAIFINE